MILYYPKLNLSNVIITVIYRRNSVFYLFSLYLRSLFLWKAKALIMPQVNNFWNTDRVIMY